MTAPILGDVQPIGYTCTLETGAGLCAEPAAVHLCWDLATMDNSVGCSDHAAEALRTFDVFDFHAVSYACGAPGSVWVTGDARGSGRCEVNLPDPGSVRPCITPRPRSSSLT